jgi:two-component system cell cycle response regulator DivK
MAGNSHRTIAASSSGSAFGDIMKRRILVVEDNQPNRELLCDWLESEGFEVVYAENLEQSYAAFEINVPHAVLLDVQLGREDGLSLARWIRQRQGHRHIPVIAVTAQAMVADKQRVIQAGCDACISKPVNFKSLSQQLELWLNPAREIPSGA